MPATVKLERWTPKKAEAALGKNHVNRNISDGKVTSTRATCVRAGGPSARSRSRSTTRATSSTGQRRLVSQVQEGKSINWVVVRAAPKDTPATINTGKPRRPGGHDEVQGRELGPHCRCRRTSVSADGHGSDLHAEEQAFLFAHTEVLDFFEKYPNLEHSAMLAAQVCKGGLLHTQPSALGAAHWWITQHVGLTEADEFLNRMTTHGGVSESDGSPVMALISRLNKINEKGIRIESRWIVYMVLKCWNYDVMGQKIYAITAMTKDGDTSSSLPRKPGLDHGMTDDDLGEDESEATG